MYYSNKNLMKITKTSKVECLKRIEKKLWGRCHEIVLKVEIQYDLEKFFIGFFTFTLKVVR